MAETILEHISNNTKTFLELMPKAKRKKKGQFFTSIETAKFMANMFDISSLPECVSICDPGAGTGLLSAALIDRLNEHQIVKSICLTCYETDPDVKELLIDNLEIIKSMSSVPVEYHLVTDSYLLSQYHDFEADLLASTNPKKYDLIISNPPYLRIMRDDPSALAMPTVVHGAPNLYFLFAAMSLFNLKDNAEMVYIIPRSWTSGAYFTRFRDYLLSNGKLLQIHLFVSRDKVFKDESVLQETMIIKVRKTELIPERVLITSSNSNNDFNSITKLDVPYSAVVAGKDSYVFLPTNSDDMNVIEKIHSYDKTMPEEGLRMRTGIVVDFRQRNELRETPGDHIVPLFYSQHIRDGKVNHNPSGKDYEWIVDEKPGLIQKNKNYVFCKRFTAKEEKRRLQCGVYMAKDFPEYNVIGTQNKINYVDAVDGSEMDLPTAYGIYTLLNSTLFDMYYRVLNGSTQVNSTEINSIPVPPIESIKEMGKRLLESNNLTTENCDRIMKEVAYG